MIDPSSSEDTLSPNQIEFLAEDVTISIIPNFKLDSLHFLSGEYGPFEPSFPVDVPLWLALTLKKKKKCKIEIPYWMSLEYLNNQYDKENNLVTEFVDLPEFFIEISTMLLTVAPEDIKNVNEVRNKLEDIFNRRQSKINDTIVKTLKLQPNLLSTLELNNLSMMEINRIRGSLISGMNHLYKIQSANSKLSSTSSTTTTTHLQYIP
eukprot:gene3688-4593_t